MFIKSINFSSVFVIVLLDFETTLTVWYSILFIVVCGIFVFQLLTYFMYSMLHKISTFIGTGSWLNNISLSM